MTVLLRTIMGYGVLAALYIWLLYLRYVATSNVSNCDNMLMPLRPPRERQR
jgi:hypothetical protein